MEFGLHGRRGDGRSRFPRHSGGAEEWGGGREVEWVESISDGGRWVPRNSAQSGNNPNNLSNTVIT